MKTYIADPRDTIVWVLVEDAGVPQTAYTLIHHVKHSPDGFSWGYEGSGPSELARCILLDLFSDDKGYQDFKRKHIAPRPMGESFSLSENEVREWRTAMLIEERP